MRWWKLETNKDKTNATEETTDVHKEDLAEEPPWYGQLEN